MARVLMAHEKSRLTRFYRIIIWFSIYAHIDTDEFKKLREELGLIRDIKFGISRAKLEAIVMGGDIGKMLANIPDTLDFEKVCPSYAFQLLGMFYSFDIEKLDFNENGPYQDDDLEYIGKFYDDLLKEYFELLTKGLLFVDFNDPNQMEVFSEPLIDKMLNVKTSREENAIRLLIDFIIHYMPVFKHEDWYRKMNTLIFNVYSRFIMDTKRFFEIQAELNSYEPEVKEVYG